jgi:PKHD-type hydroxylase
MNLSNYYYYFSSAVPPKLCDEIIKHALSKKDKVAKTMLYENKKLTKKDYADLRKKRDSNIVWLNDPWIYREICPYILMANEKAGWNFQWDSAEDFQFTKYKVNQYYDWHADGWNLPYPENHAYKGKIRKLSLTLQLTDGSEYEGGELEFDFRDYDPHTRDESKHVRQAKEILPKGSIVVFPSFVWHRVKPVTKGVRYSLVIWNLGNTYL